jgi:hypothetical protein
MYGKPYRGFESLSLRQQSGLKRILAFIFHEILEKMPVFWDFCATTGPQRTD